VTLLILFFVLSIAFSFLCSILEAVLLSTTPAYISNQVQNQTSIGKLLDKFKEDIDRPLSAILTLNTIAHTIGAIGVGAQAGKLFGKNYFDVLGFSVSYESIIAGVMTLAILILSEIIPKTLGANNWRSLAPISVRIIRGLMWILAPLVWLSQLITRSMKKDKSKSVLSRADFAAMTHVGESSGALEKSESTIIKNLLNFEKLSIRDIMTPRSVAFMAPADISTSEFLTNKEVDVYSRVPVFKEDKDNVIGFVLKDDVLKHAISNEKEVPISKLIRDVRSVDQALALPGFFKLLAQTKQHLFIVNDEFGNVVGLVTMEDLFETLLGQEIVDESDTVVNLQDYARKKWEEKNS
jgi:CBS domain containing-hemolysin-like protein